MFEALKTAATGHGEVEPEVLVARLVVAFGLGLVTAGVYHLSCGRGSRGEDRSFLATLVLLSVLICLVTVAIGDNIARAFSLVGTLAIVRFRTVVEDTRDTAFVIYAVGAGMCAGSGYAYAPLAAAPMVFAGAAMFSRGSAKPAPTQGRLVLCLAAGRPADDRIEEQLKQHSVVHRLIGMETARGGAALDITYSIGMPAPEQVYLLVNGLGKIEGVQGVELKAD